MITLRVQFPQTQWPGWTVPEYILNSCASTVTPTPLKSPRTRRAGTVTVRVDPDTNADYYSDTAVFRASVRDKDGGAGAATLLLSHSTKLSSSSPSPSAPTHAHGLSLALKFAFRDDLAEDLAVEASMYEGVLKPLQGVSVPRCFGFFTGTGEDGQQIACLVLEYWGESLRQPFWMLPFDVRIRILERLRDLHRCGLHHGDFAERNVLTRGNDIRLIDFDQSEYHDCDCDATFDFWKPGSNHSDKFPRDADEFGCPELWEICRSELRIWD